MESQTSPAAKQKLLFNVLETLLETQPGLERLVQEVTAPGTGNGQDLAADCRAGPEKSDEERDEESAMLDTLLARVQATLLAIYRLQAARTPKKGKEASASSEGPGHLVTSLYADSLKILDKSAVNILKLLQQISKEMSHLRTQ